MRIHFLSFTLIQFWFRLLNGIPQGGQFDPRNSFLVGVDDLKGELEIDFNIVYLNEHT